MSNQEQDVSKANEPSENSPSQTASDSQISHQEETSLSAENVIVKDAPVATEQEKPPRRAAMPQDIRYATEHDDRDKLLDKYNSYQVSDTNACRLRFLTDHRQKKNLLGRNEGMVQRIEVFRLSGWGYF